MGTLCLFSAVLLPCVMLAAPGGESQSNWRVYIGPYTGGGSDGIYVAEYDAKTGKLAEPALATKTENPSFLAKHPTLPVVYAVGEAGAAGGTVSAFRIDASTGMLTLINQKSSVGNGPCHVAVSPSGGHVAVANYGGGSVTLLPVADDGSLGDSSSFVQHVGTGPDPKRQEGPHAHAVYFDGAGKFLYVADLGLDQVLVYDVDGEKGTLTPHTPPHVMVPPGQGPRHIAFHPSGRFAFVNNEMGNTVTVFALDSATAEMKALHAVSTLPADFSGTSYTAEIEVHPSGQFLYVSNRGDDSIAMFGIDQQTGALNFTGTTSTLGKWPRNFAIAPDGKFLLVANQHTADIHVLQIDAATGGLSATGNHISVDKPVCILFVAK